MSLLTRCCTWRLLCLVLCCCVRADDDYTAAPQGKGIYIEAEHFKLSRGWWVVAEEPKGRELGASGWSVLHGGSTDRGKVTWKLKNAPVGKHRIWIRVAQDSKAATMPGASSGFRLSVRQNHRLASHRDFTRKAETEVGLSTESDNNDIMEDLDSVAGLGKAPFRWETCEVNLTEGEVVLSIEKITSERKVLPAPPIDCVYITPDLKKLEPKISDIEPRLFVRVVVPKTGTSLVLVAGGRNWGWKKRISLGRFGKVKQSGSRDVTPVPPGEASAWVDLSARAKFDQEWYLLSFFPIVSKGAPKNTPYTLEFATKPNTRSIFKRVEATGASPQIRMWGSIGQRGFCIDIDSANWVGRKIASLPAPKGKRPRKFPVATAVCVGACSRTVVEQELKNVAALGFNSYGLGSSDQFFFDYGRKHGYRFLDAQKFGRLGAHVGKCRFHGDPHKTAQNVLSYYNHLKANNALQAVPFVNLADEPGCNFNGHVAVCPQCVAGFPMFLKKNGVTANELGLDALDNAVPRSFPKGQDALHYWSMRYYTHTMGGWFRTTSQELARRGLRAGVNFACQVIGNVAYNGANWFELYRNGDLTYGWTEDWFNMCGSYQFAGFQMAVMRAACKPAGVPYGTYCVVGNRTPWDIGCKSFSQLGRKLDSFKIFNYGPSYANDDNFNRREPELLESVRDVNYAIGAVEDIYMTSQPVRGDVAMLYTSSTDIWTMRWHSWFPGNLPGLERSTLYLLLGQCGARVDILHETDLERELSHYRVLFAVDSHIHKKHLPAIVNWVKGGGALYLGCNALARDHYNRPTNIETLLRVRRGEFRLQSHPGIIQGRTPDPLAHVTVGSKQIPVFHARQPVQGSILFHNTDNTPAVALTHCGRGLVILCGFCPGLSHYRRGKHNSRVRFQSRSIFPEDTRELMRTILKRAKVSPAIRSSHPMVEAHLLQAPTHDLIVLSNWTGMPQTVTIDVANRSYVNACPVRGVLKGIKKNASGCQLRITLGTGDFIKCQR